MKRILILIIVALSLKAMAESEQEHLAKMRSRGTFFEKGFCVQTFPLQYMVNQKIDKNHYGAVTLFDHPELMLMNRHAVIEMDNFNPQLDGYLNTNVEYIGTKNITLANGFDAKADILKQCKQVFKCSLDGVFSDSGRRLCPTKKLPIDADRKKEPASALLENTSPTSTERQRAKDYSKCNDDCFKQYPDDKAAVNTCYDKCMAPGS